MYDTVGGSSAMTVCNGFFHHFCACLVSITPFRKNSGLSLSYVCMRLRLCRATYDTHKCHERQKKTNFIHIIHTTQVRVAASRRSCPAPFPGTNTPRHTDDRDDAVSSVHRRFSSSAQNSQDSLRELHTFCTPAIFSRGYCGPVQNGCCAHVLPEWAPFAEQPTIARCLRVLYV